MRRTTLRLVLAIVLSLSASGCVGLFDNMNFHIPINISPVGEMPAPGGQPHDLYVSAADSGHVSVAGDD